MQPKPFSFKVYATGLVPTRELARFVIHLEKRHQMKIDSSTALTKLSKKELKAFLEAFPKIQKMWEQNGFEALETQAADSIVNNSPASGSGGKARSVATSNEDEVTGEPKNMITQKKAKLANDPIEPERERPAWDVEEVKNVRI